MVEVLARVRFKQAEQVSGFLLTSMGVGALEGYVDGEVENKVIFLIVALANLCDTLLNTLKIKVLVPG